MNRITKPFRFVVPMLVLASGQLMAQDQPGIHLQYMDTSVHPGDDFFRFVNGKWFDATEIPGDRTRWGSFDELRQNTDKDALAILKKAINNPAYTIDTDQGKAIAMYQSILDTVTRNKQGAKPLDPYLKKIDRVKNTKDLQALMVEMSGTAGIGFFGVYVGSDAKNSNRYLINVGPGSVGLPDRDYYVGTDKDSEEKRQKYVAHIARMLRYIGSNEKQAAKDAQAILALEIKMSEPRFNRVERRDRRLSYNPMTPAELQKLTPSIQWSSLIKDLGYSNVDTVVVSQPKYMNVLEGIFAEQDLATWKAYMKWTLLNRFSGTLSTEIENANWEFFGKTLTGALKQRPREERALQTINGGLGEALGKLYVEEKFPPQAKEKAALMIDYVFKAYENRINDLPWMNAETKKMAIAKLHKINVKIGYPDVWKDYSDLTLVNPSKGGTYFSNSIAMSQWRNRESKKELYKPVDKTRWGMSPQTVNAYYSPSFNEIVFPAAILQPPFYNYLADEAVNFGGIGAVIGHEISHGFDDSGARYNAEGNLVNWWLDEDLAKFTELGQALSDQYSKLEPVPGTFVDGKFTLGENIGDLGGVQAAYDGLLLYMKDHGRPELIDGYTPEQRFFISWATIWRTKSRDEGLVNQVKTDPHAPGMYRAYVPLQNVDAFYDAFQIKADNKLYISPEKRVKIW